MNTMNAMIAIEQKLISDETLLRLLHYAPETFYDDPLSTDKPNLVDVDSDDYWSLVKKHIKKTPYVDDLTDERIGRVIFYIGDTFPTDENADFHDVRLMFDVFCHHSFEEGDYRLEKLMDHLHTSLKGYKLYRTDKDTAEKIGIGQISYLGSEPLGTVPGYIGHRMTYTVPIINGRVGRRGSRY
ncbi:hypothetical protein EVJ32_05185 [Exiguobacterium sp. SH5S4]|uniref:hypothetical protein n=1 Tax=Exiguobacterium sp. SH5S4 TaxID=2510961 RepID=UPI00103E546B|nr:hypothetical protein [Exiguobacterium sp. SH5S4]TCI26772.1 hypothetical protein EVJ32_05185 [Exiguobacterium sp. SH5S4]